jgi:Xaa-Pro aminopeptidase
MKKSREILVNLDRLNQKLDEHGLAAVVARAGVNYTYLSGVSYPGTLARHLDLTDSPRGTFVVWPREGEPRIVLNTFAEGLTRRDSWIELIEVYEAYREPPVERLATVISEMGLADAVIGFERNFLSAADWESLRALLPKLRMVDSTAVMDEVRAVKTPGEVALLKRAADILDDAYAAVLPTIRPRMRERDVHARLVAECLVRGCEFVHGILNSQRNTIAYAGESDFEFADQDAVRNDYVAYLHGYPGHQSRCAVVGEPTAEQRRQYRVMRDIYRACADQCRVGRTAGEIYADVVERFSAAGMRYVTMLAGHSVGCWWHQQEPVIARGNPRRLEEAMVIAMEPHINHWHIRSSARTAPSSCPTNSIRMRSSAADESTAQADGGVSNGLCRRHQVGQKDAFIGGRPFLIDANVSGAILNRWDAEPLLDDIAVAYVAEPPVGTNVRRLA